MAALTQTYPQQSNTVTMLQTRTATTNGMIPSTHGQTSPQYMGGSSQSPRSGYGVTNPSGYRTGQVPVQPYAYTTTPNLNQNMQWQPQYGGYRTNSSPAVPMVQSYNPNGNFNPRVQQQNIAMTGYGYNSMGVSQSGSRDDSAIPPTRNIAPAPRPQSAYLSGPAQQSFTPAATASNKATPDRYRRASASQQNQHTRSQSTTLPTVGMPTANQLYNGPNTQRSTLPNRPSSFYGGVPNTSMDDMILYRHSTMDDSSRSRRRSMRGIESPDAHRSPAVQDKSKVTQEKTRTDKTPTAAKTNEKDSQTLRVVPNSSAHSRNGSSESVSSSRSSHSRPGSATNRNASVSTTAPSSPATDETTGKQDQAKLVNIPPRASSADAAKRTLNPSPLSRPATMASDAKDDSPAPAKPTYAAAVAGNLESPAAKQLAAINKGGKAKTKTSRLRRAFSFGSAADFRKAAGQDADGDKNEPSRLHKDPTPDEAYDAEQARIAEAQEAAGIGNSIYGGRFFGGSTDNLSISSTASSASVMIRKMGRGMKKSGRSFVGLFRPKSVIGVPAADGPIPEGSQAEVSMITVEAESQRVNVSADPKTSDGFPHLERNSIDTNLGAEIAQSLNDNSNPNGRKSIVGGDKERAEVLAAVRKGILKRPGSSSPSSRPVDASPGLDLPGVPAVTDSPNSSAPSTPNDDAVQRRNGSIAVGTDDYFTSALRFRQDTKSAPGTPSGKRNATFSPRIIFHDTWPSQEYDRRGEVATCNRLTPMLAQQIKEELNTFKMEMEVHENSKIYTHFF